MVQVYEFSSNDFRVFIEDTCERLAELDVIYQRSTRLVVRRPWLDGSDVIVKLWARPDIPGTLRRRLKVSAPCYEWRNLNRIRALGVPVPEPIAYGNIGRNPTGYNEALVMEDLGVTSTATDYLIGLIKEKNEAAIRNLEDAVIEMTGAMVRGRIIDYDHSMVNIVVTKSGDPYRLDLEQARQVPSLFLWRQRYIRMLGQLIGSFVFAVQPDTNRAVRFAERLFEEISPPPSILPKVQQHVNKMMHTQYEYNGMKMVVDLPGLPA